MADFKLQERWAELTALFFVVLGFMISVLLRTPAISYLAVLLSGLLAGRICFIERYKQPIFPFILIVLGFLAGYVAGSFWVSRFWIVIFFSLGGFISYHLHRKGMVVTFKSKDFIE